MSELTELFDAAEEWVAEAERTPTGAIPALIGMEGLALALARSARETILEHRHGPLERCERCEREGLHEIAARFRRLSERMDRLASRVEGEG